MKNTFSKPASHATLDRILDAAREPTSIQDLMKVTGLSLSCVRHYTTHLRDQGRMHVGRRGRKGTVLLQAGSGEDVGFTGDVQRPAVRATNGMQAVREALREPMTSAEVAQAVAYEPSYVRKKIIALRRAGLVHISGWKECGGGFGLAPIYAAGAGIDAEYVPAKVVKPVESDAVDPFETRCVTVKKATTSGQARRDPWAAALFGEYRSGVAA